MQENIFYRLDPLLTCLVFMGLLVAVANIGFLIKKKRLENSSDVVEKSDLALIIGAVITLLALLLGFTYAMSERRFETRRQLVIKETNAIGTTYLRAKTLPEPHNSEVQELLRQYTSLRVEAARLTEVAPEKIREVDNRTKQLHGLMWSHAATLAREKPDSPVIAVFLVTLNEMIDLHSERLAEFRNRVPFSIYLILFIVSAISLLLAGFYFGSYSRRGRILTTILALLVASVMWLILDLDLPTHGTIRTSQQSLIDLHQDLSQESKDAVKSK